MRKLFLAAVTVAAVLSSSCIYAEDSFYIKGYGGPNWLEKIPSKPQGEKNLEADMNTSVGLGAGYYIMDNLRADITWDSNLFDHIQHKTREKKDAVSGAEGSAPHSSDNKSESIKSKHHTFMANVLFDFADLSAAKLFVGGGVGLSALKGKMYEGVDITQLKAKRDLAYALHLGASTELSPGINGELMYSYKNLGKYKKQRVVDSVNPRAYQTISGTKDKRLSGHHIAVGLRFNL